ncbi:MAG: DUF1249 domain-containing protein [Parahaliea sp.]
MSLQRSRKRQYKLDIASLHAVCEANYVRLLRLFPDYEHSNCRTFQIDGAHVLVEVLERSRYTTIFRLGQHCKIGTWPGNLRLEVRAYHDAAMLEVGAFQARRWIAARYDYPNTQMHQKDEKLGQNQFLAEWLEHCLGHGRALHMPGFIPSVLED